MFGWLAPSNIAAAGISEGGLEANASKMYGADESRFTPRMIAPLIREQNASASSHLPIVYTSLPSGTATERYFGEAQLF